MTNFRKKVLAPLLALALAAGLAMPAAAQPFAEKQFFQAGDYNICYRVVPARGEQVGRVFFIHGMVSSTVYWEELAGLFSEAGYMCAMIDLPGFGYSTRESKDVTPKPREEIAAELMEFLAPGEKWVVAGHSMGGGVALNMAVAVPDKVEALLLYAPAAGGGGPMGANGMLGGLPTEFAGRVLTVLLKPLLYMGPVVRLLAAAANADLCYGLRYDIGKIVDPLKLPGTVTSILYMSQRSTPADLEAAAKLDIPVLLLWGEKDYIVTGQMAESLAAALPRAVSQTMQGGHMFAEQYAAEAFGRSMAFLGK
jgi:alpha-beta hydrolase superfamily lysophospholipase